MFEIFEKCDVPFMWKLWFI